MIISLSAVAAVVVIIMAVVEAAVVSSMEMELLLLPEHILS